MGVVSQDGLQLPLPGVLDAKEPVAPTTSISKEELELSETVPELLQVEAAGETKPQEVELKAPEVPELVVCEGLQIGTPEPVPVVEAPIIAAPGEESKLETSSMLQEGIQEKAPALLLEAQKIRAAMGELEVEMTKEAPVAAVEGLKLEAPEISELDAEAPSLVIPEEGVILEASGTPELVTALEGVRPEVPDIPEVAVCERRTLEATEPVTATEGLELKKPEEEDIELERPEAPETAVLDKEVKLDTAEVETEVTVPGELEKLEAQATAIPEKEIQPGTAATLQEDVVLHTPLVDSHQETPITEVPKEESQIETPEVLGETMELPESRKDETEVAYIETAKEIVGSAVDKAKEKFAEEQAAVEPIIVRGSAEEVERKREPETKEVQPEFIDIPTPVSAEMEIRHVQFLSGVDAVHDDNALISEILGEDTAAATAERPEDLVAKPETQPITQEEDVLSQEAPKPTEVGIAGPQELLMEDFPTGETPKVEEALISKPDEPKADDTVVQQLIEAALDIVEETESEKIEKPTEKPEVQKPEHIEEPKPEKAETLDAEIPEVPKPEAVETVKSEEIEVPRTEETEAQRQAEKVQETEIPKMEEADVLKPKETDAPEEEFARGPPAEGEQAPKPEEVEILGETEMEMSPMQVAKELMKVSRPEKVPEQETRPEELPDQESRPEELPEQKTSPKEFPEHEPRPEEITEKDTRPEQLLAQDTKPEELPEQETRPEELHEQETKPEELPPQEPRPEDLTLTEQETRPEELPEQEVRPEELADQKPSPDKLTEQESRPEELHEQEIRPKELPPQEPRTEKLPEQETKPEELAEQEPRPEELPEQETRPEEIPEQEEAYTQAAKEIVASAINGAKEQFIKEQAEIKETKPEEEITREVKTEFPGDKPDELIQMETAETPKAAAVDIDRIKPEDEAEVTEEDKIPVVVKDEPEGLREDETEAVEPAIEVTPEGPQEATPGGAVVKETEPAALSVTVVEAQQLEVSALSEEKVEKVPEDETPKEPTDGDVGAELADVVVPEKTEEPTEDKLREVSTAEPYSEIVEETVPLTKVEEQSKPEATTVPESQEFVEEIKPMDKTDKWELAAEGDARAERELKPEEPVPAKPQEQETETKPEEEKAPETETKPEEEQAPETETKPEEEQAPETETKPEEAKGK